MLPELELCQPSLPGVDWTLLQDTNFVFVGTGAVNRPLALQLAWLGMKRCVVIDPKRYKNQSVVSQCESQDVGQFKAEVVAGELQEFGVNATPLVLDVDVVPPGYLTPNSLVAVAVDNRRADICANRLAARMRCPVVKINVEPAYLTAAIRCFNLREFSPAICMECQMSNRHYEQQLHPLSCDGGGGTEQATGSPRPLSQLAANAGALAIAQIVGSPNQWAPRWWGKQWQQNLLGGQGSFSDLHPNPNCRWNHEDNWKTLTRVPNWESLTLADLAKTAEVDPVASLHMEFSGRMATRVLCSQCHQQQSGLWGFMQLDQPATICECGGESFAIPYYTHKKLRAEDLKTVWDMPLSEWGTPPGSVLNFTSSTNQHAFCLPMEEGYPQRGHG